MEPPCTHIHAGKGRRGAQYTVEDVLKFIAKCEMQKFQEQLTAQTKGAKPLPTNRVELSNPFLVMRTVTYTS